MFMGKILSQPVNHHNWNFINFVLRLNVFPSAVDYGIFPEGFSLLKTEGLGAVNAL